jgi:hypothetical protein
MTFSSASVSACEVDDVAATAAGAGGLRAGGGGKAACLRVAGSIAGAAGAGATTGAVFLASVFVAARMVVLVEALGAMLRAIGRGFGNGTFGMAQASAATADNTTASARLVAKAVDRNAAAREDGGTAFLRGESFNRSIPRSI